MADEIPDDVVYLEVMFKGPGHPSDPDEPTRVVHRIPVTPEQARRWLEGEEALGMGRGEPFVSEIRELIEHHGLPEDPHAEPVNPEVLGVPLDPEDGEAFDCDEEDENLDEL